jgi:hypothetical protein
MTVREKWLGVLVLLGLVATLAAPVFACGPNPGGGIC